MKAEIFESIYDGYINGLSYSELSSRLKLSPGYVSGILSAMKYATKDELQDYFVNRNLISRTPEELIRAVKEAVDSDCCISYAGIKYNIEYNQPAKLMRRYKQNNALTPEDLADMHIPDHKKPPVNTGDDDTICYPEEGIVCMVADDITPEEPEQMTDTKRIFGRAAAQPRVFRSKEKKKSKKHGNAAAEGKSASSEKTEVKQEIIAEDKSLLFRGHPASKYLTEDGRYTGGGRGRMPYIDPSSEGFDRLPPEVQIASLKRRLEEREAEKAALLKKRKALLNKPSE